MTGFFKMKQLLFIIFAAIFVQQNALAKSMDHFTFISEQYPPYNYQNDQGELTGISVDVLEIVLKKLDAITTTSMVRIMSWPKAYQKALTEENTVLFSTARTPTREKLFKWAGPIVSNHVALFAKKDHQIKITSLKDIKKNKIAAIKDDTGAQALLSGGVDADKISYATSFSCMLKMIDQDQVDLIAYTDTTAQLLLKSSGQESANFETVYSYPGNDYYFAFNNKTDDLIIKSFQKIIDNIKIIDDQTGKSELQLIIEKYIN